MEEQHHQKITIHVFYEPQINNGSVGIFIFLFSQKQPRIIRLIIKKSTSGWLFNVGADMCLRRTWKPGEKHWQISFFFLSGQLRRKGFAFKTEQRVRKKAGIKINEAFQRQQGKTAVQPVIKQERSWRWAMTCCRCPRLLRINYQIDVATWYNSRMESGTWESLCVMCFRCLQ